MQQLLGWAGAGHSMGRISGKNETGSAEAFGITDHCPPPTVAVRGGSDSLGVLRLEHGLLHRLVHAFLGLVAGLKEIWLGSIVLL
jgi:hypothetical protein